MKAVACGNGTLLVELEEGDPTGCPVWCDTNHVGEQLLPGEKLAHQRNINYQLSFATSSTTARKAAEGEGAFVHIWQRDDELTVNVCDAQGDEFVGGLAPIGAWTLAHALREAALRADPRIQLHDSAMAELAYKAEGPYVPGVSRDRSQRV